VLSVQHVQQKSKQQGLDLYQTIVNGNQKLKWQLLVQSDVTDLNWTDLWASYWENVTYWKAKPFSGQICHNW